MAGSLLLGGVIDLGKNNVSLRGKSILGLEYLSADEMNLVLDTAKEMKNIMK